MFYGDQIHKPPTAREVKGIRPQPPQLGRVYRFFCWCSGGRLYLLNQCPSDFNKFFGIGIIVCLTGFMASLSGGYALYTVFGNSLLSCLFGAFWGILIFFIDWYIVSSLRKENKFRKEILTASPRIVLALLISVIISKPLELKLFQKEIDQQIENMKRDKEHVYQAKVDKNFTEIAQLQQQNKQLEAEVTTLEAKRAGLFEAIVSEAEGRSFTKMMGKGPVYREKKAEFDRIDEDLRTLREKNGKTAAENNQRIRELQQKRDLQIASGNTLTDNYNGFLARLEAFGQLCAQNGTVNTTNWFIIILFIIIETSPMIVKLISDRGAYDEMFELEEQRKMTEINSERRNIRIAFENRYELTDYIDKLKTDSAREVNKKFIDDVTVANHEINTLKVEKWKTREQLLAESDVDRFIEAVSDIYKESSQDNAQDDYVI